MPSVVNRNNGSVDGDDDGDDRNDGNNAKNKVAIEIHRSDDIYSRLHTAATSNMLPFHTLLIGLTVGLLVYVRFCLALSLQMAEEKEENNNNNKRILASSQKTLFHTIKMKKRTNQPTNQPSQPTE